MKRGIRRVRQIAKTVSELYGVHIDNVQPLNEYFYQYEKGSRALVARVLAEPEPDQQRTEVAWLNYLADHGVGIVRAVPSVNENLVESVSIGDEQHCVVSLERAMGAPPTYEEWNCELFKRLGSEIGKMHALTRDFHVEFPGLHRKVWYEWYIYDPNQIPEQFEVARSKCIETVESVKAYPQDSSTYGLIHGDIHQWNLHIWQDEITIFDTNECETHHFVHDLGVLINSAIEESFNGSDINSYAELFIGSLLDGYREHHSLPGEWIERLPVFIRLREIMSFIDAFAGWDMSQISLHQRIALNRWQNAIENDIPLLRIDFGTFA